MSGPDGVCGVRGDDDEALLKVAENCPFKINVDFFRNNKTKTLLGDLLACYLTLHALVFADYPTLRRDLTRRVFPIFTEVSLAPIRLRAMRAGRSSPTTTKRRLSSRSPPRTRRPPLWRSS